MKEVFHSGLPIEKTFASIIQSAHNAKRHVIVIETRSHSATSMSMRDVILVTRYHVHFATIGEDISLSAHSMNVNKLWLGSTSAVSIRKGFNYA